jgi:zinc protease
MRPVVLAGAVALISCGTAAPPPPKPVAAPSAGATTVPPPVADPDAWRGERPKPGPPSTIHYPDVDVARLDNGLAVYVMRRPVGVASLSILARGGGARLPLGKSGLAALTARMMTEGTTKRNALATAEAAESLGSTLEQSAGRDYVRLGLLTAREDFDKGLELLSEVVQKPAFAKKELERVRAEWLDSIDAERQSPSRLASLAGLRLLLGNAAGAPVNGSRKDVQALQREDLVKFHRDNFVPENMAILVVGDLAAADVKSAADKHFGGFRAKGTTPPAEPERPPAQASRRVVIVDRGASSVGIATRDWGAFVVMTSVRTDVTAEALSEAVAELEKVRIPGLGRPITPKEVDVARADLKQRLGTSLVHAGETAGRVQELFVYGLGNDYYGKYPSLLDGFAPAQVATEGERIDPARALVVVVGDKSQIEPTLRGRFRAVEIAPEGILD